MGMSYQNITRTSITKNNLAVNCNRLNKNKIKKLRLSKSSYVLQPMLGCPLVVINVITAQTHLPGLICVRNSDSVGRVWNVIVWLILVDVLN